MNDRFSVRFKELLQEAGSISQKTVSGVGIISGPFLADYDAFVGWQAKSKHLLAFACGKDSVHLQAFEEHSTAKTTDLQQLQRLAAIVRAAQEDYDGGYITTVRKLVQAEVFSDELEQARELARLNYISPAAVVAGVVLETALKDLCTRHALPHGKLDKMNADLVKVGVYNLLVQKRITTLAQIRNDAAHGNHTSYNKADVDGMIGDVERFLTDYL